MFTWWVNLSPSLIVICWKPSSFNRSKKFASSAIVRSWKKGESRDMVVMLQGFVVLFSGAMSYVVARPLGVLLRALNLDGAKHG